MPKLTMPELVAVAGPRKATATDGSADALQQLRADLAAEQSRRQQAEQDFQVQSSTFHLPLVHGSIEDQQ